LLQLVGTAQAVIPSASSGPASRVHSISFDETGGTLRGSFDIGRTPLVVDYSGGSPVAAVARYLQSGYAPGSWNGTGRRRAAAAVDNQRRTALGFAEASAVLGPTGGTFEGLSVDETALLVKYTVYGDANLDSSVDTVDFNLLVANFSQFSKHWFNGDFNYDG